MATTKITNPELFDLGSLNTALKLPSGTTAERPTSPSTGEWRYNTDNNLIEYYDGGSWRDLQSEEIPPIPSENFNTVIWDGDSTDNRAIEVGFQPDMVWYKTRNAANDHNLSDSTRGAAKQIRPNRTIAEVSATDQIKSFTSTGFTVGTGGDANSSGNTYVAWCWKANGGTTSSNTDGTITSTVQANTKAGFSIIKFTGTGATATVGHGLNSTPEIYFMKNLDQAGYKWPTHTQDAGSLSGNNTGALNETSSFSSYTPTANSTTIGLASGQADRNPSGQEMIVYAFHSVAGYSKIGTYTGNGSITGPLVNTGFEPAMIIIKEYDGVDNWAIVDNKRSTTNPRQNWLRPNLSNVEFNNGVDSIIFLSNGFQIGGGSSVSNFLNENGKNYIYIAFGSDGSAAPALADSFTNKLYTGNGSSQSISGLGFQPDFVWLKQRSGTQDQMWYDSNRGAGNYISSNSTAAQGYANTTLTSFDSDGFSVGSSNSENQNGQTFVAWNWKANPIPTINTDGTIQSVVSANQASGFSIVEWTGDGSASATVGHGLSGTPDFIMLKDLTDVGGWNGAHVGLASNEGISLNSSAAAFTSMGNNGGITYANLSATNFGFATGAVGVDSVNKNGNKYIAYCWKSIAGFSKMGTYTGNGSTQSITGLGFQPSWVLIKETSAAESWRVFDSARGATERLFPNTNGAESTAADSLTAFDSDGFSLGSSAGVNENTQTYIYMAYKENPVQYPIASGEMGYLVAAGGGSGANSGAGGGAGGLRTTYGTVSGGGANAETNLTLAAGTYTITVGAGGVSRGGGSSAPAYGGQGLSGSVSTITGVASVSTVGGGGGGSNSQSAAPPISASGLDGGSGGGQGPSAASGETPGSGTANEGFGGGTSSLSSPYSSGGGGGAGSTGGNRVGGTPGNGGNGLTISITGSNSGYAGGGGGSGGVSSNFGLGTSGGGNGAPSTGTGISGTANTGGGGGGGGDTRAAGSGGSGIVVLRLNTSDYSGVTSGSPTVTTVGTETVLTFTGSGTYVHS